MLLNLRHLEVFQVVVASGSATKASELLGISQPAVSRAISGLEAVIGFSLFDRVSAKLVVTPEGKLFFEEVTKGFEVLDRIQLAAARIRDRGSGLVRFACLPSLGSNLAVRALADFKRQYPDVSVAFRLMDSHSVRDAVASGQSDLGLAADQIRLAGVEHQVFGAFDAICALPPGHPLEGRSEIHPEDLHRQPFIALARGDTVRQRLDHLLGTHGVEPYIMLETPDSATVCHLALEGVGLGIANPQAALLFEKQGLITRPFTPPITFNSYILYRPDAQKSAIVRVLAAALMNAR